MTGLGERNLVYMRDFARAWTDEPMLPRAVATLPWGRIRCLLNKRGRRKGVSGRLRGASLMIAANAAIQASVDARWSTRLREDRRRAVELQTSSQREATETIRQRAIARGVEAVALTGSTVRARRTAVSDLDFMIVGERPDSGGVCEDVDVYAASAEAFWERLLAGDDYIQWTLRFGCILHDAGILRAASRHIEENGLMPSAERKRTQAHRGLSLAWCVLDSGDVDAAHEQCRAALTTIARWLLIANGEFPLSRDELSEQLLILGCPELAVALHRVIHNEPSLAELRIGLRLGENLITAPQGRLPARLADGSGLPTTFIDRGSGGGELDCRSGRLPELTDFYSI